MGQIGESPTSSIPENPLVLAIQTAIQDILIDGTRYAVELKASDKLIERNADLLRQDPSNQTMRSDQARKIAARDDCLNQIKDLSSRVSSQLYHISIQNFSQSSCKSEPTDPVSDNLPNPQEALNSTHQRFELLETQILKNQHELEAVRQNNQQVVDTLRLQLDTQTEEISNLKQLIQESTSLLSNGPQVDHSEDKIVVWQTSDPGSTDHLDQVEEISRGLSDIAKQFDELQSKVITILTKEIPVNLQQSVRLIQQDVDSAALTALQDAHKQITDLVSKFENRISALEQIASRATSTGHSADPSKPVPVFGNQNTNSSSSKDPRLLRRQSRLASTAKLSSGNNPNCTPQ